MILSVESDEGLNEDLISLIQDALGCDDEDHAAALEHIDEHRDGGKWGGRRDAVLKRSTDRVNEALTNGQLPDSGPVADGLASLLDEGDDGEIDPFAELGVQAGAASVGGAADQGADLLAAFMDDDEEEEDMVDSGGFLTETIDSDGEPTSSESDDESEAESEAESDDDDSDSSDSTEQEQESESTHAVSPLAAYEMLMSTCWVDGILDPAEAKLLARKRDELSISFEDHLTLLREMLERES